MVVKSTSCLPLSGLRHQFLLSQRYEALQDYVHQPHVLIVQRRDLAVHVRQHRALRQLPAAILVIVNAVQACSTSRLILRGSITSAFLIHFLLHEANRGLVTHSRNQCAVPDFLVRYKQALWLSFQPEEDHYYILLRLRETNAPVTRYHSGCS